MTELSVNVDHVATLRQARGGLEPDPARAAVLALDAGASGITVHLREDRRHIQDRDLEAIRALRRGELNLEMALTDEMIQIAIATSPERVTLVPERRAELTTEGGLDLRRDPKRLAQGCGQLTRAGLPLSLFLDPDPEIATLARDTGATIVEIHTGHYANARGADSLDREINRVADAARAFEAAGLKVHAGHGLNTTNVGPLLRRYRFGEMSIGHHIISRAIEIGMTRAVREMIEALHSA
jgi:pyridoxine 5-phosphate synthase